MFHFDVGLDSNSIPARRRRKDHEKKKGTCSSIQHTVVLFAALIFLMGNECSCPSPRGDKQEGAELQKRALDVIKKMEQSVVERKLLDMVIKDDLSTFLKILNEESSGDIDINVSNHERPLLALAILHGHQEFCMYLATREDYDINNVGSTVEKNNDAVNHKEEERIPLHMASLRGNLPLVRAILARKGCNTSSLDSQGRTALQSVIAARKKMIETSNESSLGDQGVNLLFDLQEVQELLTNAARKKNMKRLTRSCTRKDEKRDKSGSHVRGCGASHL